MNVNLEINNYDDIFGWFDYKDIFDEAILKSKDGDSFIEIGVYMGKSTAYLLSKIKESGKNITLNAIDLFDTSNIYQSEDYPEINYKLEDIFDSNMAKLNLSPIKYKGNSNDLHKKFKKESQSMIFIDGSHDFDSVTNDMNNYFPKLKKDGIFAGHDYTNSKQVSDAVNLFSVQNNLPITIRNSSWFMIKK